MQTKKATGPRTEEGKKRSSLNALKHGNGAKSAHALQKLAEERMEDFERILSDLRNQYRPMDTVEEQLVRRIARCIWRLAEGEAMERKLMERRANHSRPSASYEKIMRYERLVDIHLHRAIAALEHKQSARSPITGQLPPGN